MLPDYYQILGIPEAADMSAVRRAYREQATRFHPDRGGSHEQMVAINEAWRILSDPESRREYDAARAAAAAPSAITVAERSSYRARQEAQYYPQQWAEFETWMDSLIRDFQKEEEGSSWHWFKYSGFAVGFAVYFLFREHFPWRGFGHVAVIGCGGLGMALHIGIARLLEGSAGASQHQSFTTGRGRESPPPPPRGRRHSVPPPFPRQAPSPSQPPSAPSQVISCPACGQNLRVPCISNDISVTCRTCRHEFLWQAAGTDHACNQ